MIRASTVIVKQVGHNGCALGNMVHAFQSQVDAETGSVIVNRRMFGSRYTGQYSSPRKIANSPKQGLWRTPLLALQITYLLAKALTARRLTLASDTPW